MMFNPHAENISRATRAWRARKIWPTARGSADLRQIASEVRARAVFSACTTNARYLQRIAEVVDDLIEGKINMADARWELLKMLKELGYDPETGFPDDMEQVPPAKRGSLQDLSSKSRLKLVLETNMRMALNYGIMLRGMEEYALYWYPAWRLVRIYWRRVPRGSEESRSAGWETRWQQAGEAVGWRGAVKHRMVALKTSPIWGALGSGAGGYQDSLGNFYPPYAFQSGYGWEPVDRETAIDWGLIKDEEGEELTPDLPVEREDLERPDVTGETAVTLSPSRQTVTDVFDSLEPDLQDAVLRELEELGV